MTRPKLRLSPSKMLLWDSCQRSFENAIVGPRDNSSNIYSAIGTAAHWVIEQINKGTVWTPEEREDQFRAALNRECLKDNLDIAFPKGYKESRETIKTYSVPEGWHFLNAESKRLIEFETFDFSYIIDANFTDADGKKLRVVDYKTSSAVPSSPRQLQLYGWAETIRLDLDPDDITSYFWMLRQNKRVEVKFNREIFDSINSYVMTSAKLMNIMFEKGMQFPETPGNCHFCAVSNCQSRK